MKSVLKVLYVRDINLFLEYLNISKMGMTENYKSEVSKCEDAKEVINFLPPNHCLPEEAIKG